MGIKDEFQKFGAVLKNVQWSVSAENSKGELVVSLWQHIFGKAVAGKIQYEDKVDRWSGPGNMEFRRNIENAYNNNTPIRVVISRTNNESGVNNGLDASKFKNIFNARLDWIGRVIFWNGNDFVIEFEKIQ